MPRTSTRPTVFVGSSTPALPIARAVENGLRDIAAVVVWDGAFHAGTWLLGSILAWAERSDFAVFVVRPDDTVRIKGTKYVTVRDNVLFEIGVFMGALGADRTLILWPSRAGQRPLRLPTDLAGLLRETYNASAGSRKGANLRSALPRIRERIKSKGPTLRSGHNEIAALRQTLKEREIECTDGTFESLGEVVTRAARSRRPPWYPVTSVSILTRALMRDYHHTFIDQVFWWLVIYGVITFNNVEVWNSGNWHYSGSLEFAVFSDRGVVLLNELRKTG